MVGVGQIPGSEVANTEELVGLAAYTYTTAGELKVEEIASLVGDGGVRQRAGRGKRKKEWGGRRRARATIQQERTHLPHLASEWHTIRFSPRFPFCPRNPPTTIET